MSEYIKFDKEQANSVKLCALALGYEEKTEWYPGPISTPGNYINLYCGGEIVDSQMAGDRGGFDYAYPNLYDPANMALAWRVLNWAGDNFGIDEIYKLNKLMLGNDDPNELKTYIWYRSEAQTAWLDKILELATEAGMKE